MTGVMRDFTGLTSRMTPPPEHQTPFGLACLQSFWITVSDSQLHAATLSRKKLLRWLCHAQSIRQQKLKEMEADGIPAKYRAELARKNFGKERL